MAKATKFADRSHARIYAAWLDLPAWRYLSPIACKLLVAMLARYRPGTNGALVWGAREAGQAVGMSQATGARALAELEEKGWITVECVGAFARKNKPSNYALTYYPNDVSGEPASLAFEDWRP